MSYPQMLNGMRVIVTLNALEDTKERLFPESRHRSKRIHKKLIKRFGGEFRKVPCIWRHGDTLIMHPVHWAEVQAAFGERT